MARRIVMDDDQFIDWDGKAIETSKLNLITTFDSLGWAELERQVHVESLGGHYYVLPFLPENSKVYAYKLK